MNILRKEFIGKHKSLPCVEGSHPWVDYTTAFLDYESILGKAINHLMVGVCYNEVQHISAFDAK